MVYKAALQPTNAVGNWIEPENSGLFNVAESNGANDVLALSDTGAVLPNDFPPVADGTSVSFGSDASDGVAIQAVWNDSAATVEAVPAPSIGHGLPVL